MARTLTAANAVITLSITGLYPVPQQLQGYAADNIFDTPAQVVNETLMGVDGILSAGYVRNPVEQSFHMQSDSTSNDIFATWASSMAQQVDTYFANGRTTLPSLGVSYVMTRGVLIDWPPMPSLAKIAQPRVYRIMWQSIQAIPL